MNTPNQQKDFMKTQAAILIKNSAQANWESLKDFIACLKNRDRRRGPVADPRGENKMLDDLLDIFDRMATSYFNQGQQCIEPISDPRERAHRNFQLLKPVIKHSQLLADLVRPHLLQRDNTSPQNDEANIMIQQRKRVEKVVAIVGERLKKKKQQGGLLPILYIASSFRYINFNYLDGVGVIGFPAQIVARPSWNLSVVWHEAAGCEAKLHEGKFKGWADDIFKNPIFVDYQKMIDDLKVGDSQQWQTEWLKQIFEDLFGVQALGGVMVETLAHTLAENYLDFDKSDATHPTPNVRLHVALAYLKLAGQDINDEELKQSCFNVEQTITSIENFYGEIPRSDKTVEAAEALAEFYRQKTETSEFSIPTSKISPIERQLAKAVAQAYYQFFREDASLDGVVNILGAEIDKLPQPETKIVLHPKDDFIQNLNLDQVIQNGDLNTLLENVHFANVDFQTSDHLPPTPPRRVVSGSYTGKCSKCGTKYLFPFAPKLLFGHSCTARMRDGTICKTLL